MKNSQSIQGILSIAALVCLAIGWFNLFTPELNHFFSEKLFYFLIGVSFIFSAGMYPGKPAQYTGYAAAALCIIGAFLPENYRYLRTIGLVAGIILSFSGRSRQ